ncbi:MAG TPA: glycine oxidase ThiO [Myxococcales bacterium]|nr:glycine oxidase ThiO [Myxococcales bacterium]
MDVAVAGGGVIGLLSALRLAQRGHRVVVIEPSEPGSEASWAAAGILGAQSEADGPGPMLDLCRRSLAMYPALAAELGDVGYSQCGALHVAFTDREAAGLRRQHEWQSAVGLHTELRVARGAIFALWHPEDAVVDNRKLTRALCAAIGRFGVEVLAARARRIRFSQGAASGVETDKGVVSAQAVVVAAGAWSAQIAGAGITSDALVPVRGQMLAYDAPPPPSVIFGAGGYVVPRGTRTLVGATVEHTGFEKRTTKEGLQFLRDVAARLVPELARLEPVDHWAGLRPGTRDGFPLLGATAPGVVVATGHYRNGILLAPVTAELVVHLIEGRSPDLRAFAPRRFGEPRIPTGS